MSTREAAIALNARHHMAWGGHVADPELALRILESGGLACMRQLAKIHAKRFRWTTN